MAGLEKTKNVSPCLNKNGFTLLESILSLVVTIIIFHWSPSYYKLKKGSLRQQILHIVANGISFKTITPRNRK
ncbi:Uncharacterised protein [Listeria fleischmannii subsp. fleischmannii]|uniref:Prepilin-type N-terminal cleavage/methylation domain-containing protein n=1 Tax=Listeria fleischmannii subsp. fleischmannii TaxID=1671902 RepID=A0A2X3GMF9_9LIST|nr:Uncharacterised protein [Listeria fleischmannii subsp. fleischmannii]